MGEISADFNDHLKQFRVALKSSNTSEAQTALEAMVLIDPPQGYYYAGREYELSGLFDDALQFFMDGSQSEGSVFYRNECWKHASRLNKDS